jgi:hypothetical protein
VFWLSKVFDESLSWIFCVTRARTFELPAQVVERWADAFVILACFRGIRHGEWRVSSSVLCCWAFDGLLSS